MYIHEGLCAYLCVLIKFYHFQYPKVYLVHRIKTKRHKVLNVMEQSPEVIEGCKAYFLCENGGT